MVMTFGKRMRWSVKIDPAYAPAGYDEYRQSFPLNGQIAEKVIPVVIEEEFRTGRLKRKLTVDEMVAKIQRAARTAGS